MDIAQQTLDYQREKGKIRMVEETGDNNIGTDRLEA